MNHQLIFSFLTIINAILAAPIPLPIAEPAAVTVESTNFATGISAAAEVSIPKSIVTTLELSPAATATTEILDKRDFLLADDYTSSDNADCSTTVTGDAAGQVVVTVQQTVIVDGNGSTLQDDVTTEAAATATTATSTSQSFYVTTWPNGEVFYSVLPETMVSAINVAPNTATIAQTTSAPAATSTEANNTQNAVTTAANTQAAETTSSTSSSTQAPEQNVTTSSAAQVGAEATSSSTSSTTTSTSSSTSSAATATSSGYLTKVPHSIVYSPYNNDGSCKAYSTVLSDLQLIQSKGINELRIYGNDCNYLSTVLVVAKKIGLVVNQGFWISDAGVDSIDTAVSDLISYVTAGSGGYGWEVFSYITIGNEAINSGYCSVSDLISKISEVKSKLQSAGYAGKVTTSEPPVSFENHPELCTSSEIDFVGINPHSYFDANCYASEAGTFVSGQIEIVQGVCGSMDIVVTETGYPNAGDTNGNNVPSPANQLAAVQSILDNVGVDVTILTTFEDMWKSPGDYNIEQHFGIIQILP